MPELPDLHVFSMNLKKRILNRTIAKAAVYSRNQFNATSAAFEGALRGCTIVDIVRVGKELHFMLSNQKVFAVHLMLNGQFHLCGAEDVGGMKYRIFSVAFEDGGALVATDFMTKCRVTLNPRRSTVPDVLDARFDFEQFGYAARSYPSLNVKAFLIDQKIMKGIGNAYADEILWKANISPASIVGKIPQEALSDLHRAIGDVLKDAIDHILRLAPDSVSGEERSFLRVHNPRKSATEEGDAILVREIAGKKTYFTEKQRLFTS